MISILRDFLSAWLPDGKFPTDINKHLELTDNEAICAMLKSAYNADEIGYEHAMRIIKRKHFRLLYQRNTRDLEKNIEAAQSVYNAAVKRFGEANVRVDRYTQRSGSPDFPVLTGDGRVVSSLFISQTLKSLPVAAVNYVFIAPEFYNESVDWLQHDRETIISAQ